MSTDRPAPHEWPEEEPARVAPPAKLGRAGRIRRAFGDIALTIGMSEGLVGDRTTGDSRAAANAILFGEGDAEGRASNRGSDDR